MASESKEKMVSVGETAIAVAIVAVALILALSGGLYDTKVISVNNGNGDFERYIRTNKLTGEVCEVSNFAGDNWVCK